MSEAVSLEIRGDVAVVTINNPPVNALGQAVRAGLDDALAKAIASSAVAIVLTGGGRAFSGGADIREFGRPLAAPDLTEVMARAERSPKPIVAAIHGVALGGGLELTLSCAWRVATPDSQVGLPEVKLGILPGGGGTQRLPRLIGPKPAIELMVSGDQIPAKAALAAGIIDAIVDGDIVEGAIAFARSVVGKSATPLCDRTDKISNLPADLFPTIRAGLAKKARNLVAPFKIVDCVEIATTTPFVDGLKRERELFHECMATTQSQGMIHIFFAERDVAKLPDVPETTPQRPIKKAVMIGAGTMGGGIAMSFANAGIPVSVIEVNDEALQRGFDKIRGNYAGTVQKGRLSQAAMDERMAHLTPTTDFSVIKDADIVIEAVFERMDVKLEIFKKIDALAKPGAILATNTSALDVNAIAASTKRPQDVVGLHFFSPANVMRLLEIVRGKKTAIDVMATVMALSRKIKKIGVVVGVCDGFVGNRMFFAYSREAEFLLAEGATPAQVDGVFTDFGLAMGPFATMDLAGVDVQWDVMKRKAKDLLPGERASQILDRLGESKRYGQKTNAGWFKYAPGNRAPLPDATIEPFFEEEAKRLGITRAPIANEEIFKRCLYAMVNEGAKILEEGMALRGSDIDVIYINGYGFPAYRGGPMFWADVIGLKNIVADIERFAKVDPIHWAVSPLLVRLANEGKSVGKYSGDKG